MSAAAFVALVACGAPAPDAPGTLPEPVRPPCAAPPGYECVADRFVELRTMNTDDHDACVRVCRCPEGPEGPPDAAAVAAWCEARGGELVSAELGRCAMRGTPLLELPALPPPEVLTPPPESWWAQDAAFRAGESGYLDPEGANAVVHALAAQHPGAARVVRLGMSHLGQPLLALRVTERPDRDEDEPAVLILATTHGDELLTPLYGLAVAEALLSPEQAALRERLDVWFVPVLNPDGLWLTLFVDRRGMRQGGRKNGSNFRASCREGYEVRRGVDLNRNYPYRWGDARGSSDRVDAWNYRGTAPGSEPETRAVMALAGERRFVAAISYHTAGSAVLSPYTIPGSHNPRPDTAWSIAQEIAAAAGFAVKRSLYPVDGTDQDWLFHAYGTLAYIAEGSRDSPTSPAVRDASVDGARAVGLALLRRVSDGPRISGRVVDADGQPAAARVSLAGEVLSQGEVWTSSPRDGRFDRLVPLGRHVVRCGEAAEAGEVAVELTVERPVAAVICALAAPHPPRR